MQAAGLFLHPSGILSLKKVDCPRHVTIRFSWRNAMKCHKTPRKAIKSLLKSPEILSKSMKTPLKSRCRGSILKAPQEPPDGLRGLPHRLRVRSARHEAAIHEAAAREQQGPAARGAHGAANARRSAHLRPCFEPFKGGAGGCPSRGKRPRAAAGSCGGCSARGCRTGRGLRRCRGPGCYSHPT